MSTTVLWFDKITPEMEKVFYEVCPDDISLKFLYPQDPGTIQGTMEEADYFLVAAYSITKDFIDRAKNLKMIQRSGVGYDAIDTEYAKAKGIPVAISAGMNAPSVSELTVLHILTIYRKIHILNTEAKEGVYDSWKYRHVSREIHGKTIGVVGAGAIGRAVIQKLQAFEPGQILYYDAFRHPSYVEEELGITFCSLNELAEKSDIVTIHIPLFESTHKLISQEFISKMKQDAILINTARGPIVDQEALIDAVRSGRLAGAGLDVFDPEPYVKGSGVLSVENIITTPHIGAATVDNYKRAISFSLGNIKRYENGEKPLNVVNGVE